MISPGFRSEERTTIIYANDTVNKSGDSLYTDYGALCDPLTLHDRFERTSFSLQTRMMPNTCQVWRGEIIQWVRSIMQSTWRVHCKTLLSGRVASPTSIATKQFPRQTRSLDRVECMPSLRGEITQWVCRPMRHCWRYWGCKPLSLTTCESRHRWPVRHLVLDLWVIARAFIWRSANMNRQDDELMFEIRELNRNLPTFAWNNEEAFAFSINMQLFVSRVDNNVVDTENWKKYSSAWTGSWQWENDDMWLKAVNLLFWTALFWGAIPSNCQGYCFETQGAVRTRSKSWISGEQESFQRRVLFLDSCYVLTAIDTGTRYDEHEFHSGSLILSTHWFGSRCDAAVQVEFSFECIPGICGWTSAWVQNGRPNHLTNSKCIRGDGRRCESKMDGRTIWRTWVSFERLILSPHWFGSCCDAAVQVEFFLFFDCVWGGLRRRESKMDGRTIRILYGWMQHESEASWHVWCVCVERWT
jgi:hypothetical protein